MMFKNDIASQALSRLAASRTIVDLDNDNSIEARIIRQHFRTSLDQLLEYHPWSFARRTATLIEHSRDPEPRYRFAYHYPVNAAVVRGIAPNGMFNDMFELYPDQETPFTVMTFGTTNLIYCNTPNAHAVYTERMPENSSFKTYFGKALAAQLSKDIGPSLITNNWPKVRDAVNASADSDISQGIAYDLTLSPQKQEAPCPLVRARWQ